MYSINPKNHERQYSAIIELLHDLKDPSKAEFAQDIARNLLDFLNFYLMLDRHQTTASSFFAVELTKKMAHLNRVSSSSETSIQRYREISKEIDKTINYAHEAFFGLKSTLKDLPDAPKRNPLLTSGVVTREEDALREFRTLVFHNQYYEIFEYVNKLNKETLPYFLYIGKANQQIYHKVLETFFLGRQPVHFSMGSMTILDQLVEEAAKSHFLKDLAYPLMLYHYRYIDEERIFSLFEETASNQDIYEIRNVKNLDFLRFAKILKRIIFKLEHLQDLKEDEDTDQYHSLNELQTEIEELAVLFKDRSKQKKGLNFEPSWIQYCDRLLYNLRSTFVDLNISQLIKQATALEKALKIRPPRTVLFKRKKVTNTLQKPKEHSCSSLLSCVPDEKPPSDDEEFENPAPSQPSPFQVLSHKRRPSSPTEKRPPPLTEQRSLPMIRSCLSDPSRLYSTLQTYDPTAHLVSENALVDLFVEALNVVDSFNTLYRHYERRLHPETKKFIRALIEDEPDSFLLRAEEPPDQEEKKTTPLEDIIKNIQRNNLEIAIQTFQATQTQFDATDLLRINGVIDAYGGADLNNQQFLQALIQSTLMNL